MACADSQQQLDATVRIDAAPSGKRFQGVWLELAATRYVIDYRANDLWRGFEDQRVTVTGHHYTPQGQAINATHFRVATMRFAEPPTRAVPYRSLAAEALYRGTIFEHVWPAGTRREGEVERRFETDDGETFALAGGVSEGTRGPVALTARIVEPDPAYAATTGEPQLYVIRVHAHDWAPGDVR